jgi:hypothetical protein
MLALGMSIFQTGVYAQGSAYTKGYKDALCDAVSCNGHGYEPSCPGDHSSEYCNNYRDGYAAGWDASPANSNRQQPPMNSPPPPFSQAPNQGQGAGNGGNNIYGNNNTLNQLQLQQEQSGNGNSGNGGNGDNRGQLPQCKAFCTGVQ